MRSNDLVRARRISQCQGGAVLLAKRTLVSIRLPTCQRRTRRIIQRRRTGFVPRLSGDRSIPPPARPLELSSGDATPKKKFADWI